MDLISMKLPKRGTKESEMAMPTMAPGREEYPYGLVIRLENDALKKLKLTKLPPVGRTMMITAEVKVIGAHESSRMESEPSRSVELQITSMAIGADEDESKET